MSHVDVCVLGAGPAGVACALMLAQQGARVVVVQHQPAATSPARRWPELLAPRTMGLLRELGLSSTELAALGRPCRGIVDRWRRSEPEFHEFAFTQCQTGLFVDRHQLSLQLIAALTARGVTLIESPTSASIQAGSTSTRVQIDHGMQSSQLTCRLIVDATGSQSRLRGVPTERIYLDHKIAMLCEVAGTLDLPDCFYLASSESGWWYAQSMPTGGTQAVFLTDGTLWRSATNKVQLLTQQLEQAFPRERLKFQSPLGTRVARTSFRKRIWDWPCLAIGDAAFTLDPLSGTGVSRAIDSGVQAADSMVQALKTNDMGALELNAFDSLRRFAEELVRRRDYYAMTARDGLPVAEPLPAWATQDEGKYSIN